MYYGVFDDSSIPRFLSCFAFVHPIVIWAARGECDLAHKKSLRGGAATGRGKKGP